LVSAQGSEESRMMGLPDGRNGFSRFDAIPACDGHPASQPLSHVSVAYRAYCVPV